jgi:hypothetical protein
MRSQKLVFIGSYVAENVSGSHRQERFIVKALENGLNITYLKPAGNWKGAHDFTSIIEFDQWKSSNKLNIFKGSVSSSKFKSLLVPLKYLLFIDVLGYGFFNTLRLLFINRKIFNSKYILIVSSPAISSAVAVYLYSKFFKTDLKYTIDMRDAWANHKSIKFLKSIRKSIEKNVLRKADHVITVSRYLQEEFESCYKINVELLYNVNVKLKEDSYNSLDKFIKNPFHKSSINICYFGSLPSGFYNLSEFCIGLKNYLNSNNLKHSIKFYFYGPCDEMLKVLEYYPMIKQICEFNSSVSHAEAVSLMKYCDAVLFFGFDAEKNAGVVSTKIFEYFFLNIKILAFDIKLNSDLDFLFKNICNESVIINDHETLSIYLLKIFNNLNSLPSCKNKNYLFELDRNYGHFLDMKKQ